MDDRLIKILKGAGKPTKIVALPDGSEVALSPYGGRVIGLFNRGDARNYFWVNPALRRVDSARRYFNSGEWQNCGGERTWLAPEVDFFFPKHPDLTFYHQPRPLDAGTFSLDVAEGWHRLSSEFEVTSYQHRKTVGLHLTKAIGPAANPLRGERDLHDLHSLPYAGYTARITLGYTPGAAPSAPVGIWSLTQMPHGGEMLIPTYGPSKPLVFFGEIPKGDLKACASLVRYRMNSQKEHKIGLRAFACTGRVGYIHGSAKSSELVVKNFFCNPSGDYIDAPGSDIADAGYCVQACNVSNPKLGHFSELEYHAPAIGGPAGLLRTEDISQTWAFRGDRARVSLVAEKLLGVPASSLRAPRRR